MRRRTSARRSRSTSNGNTRRTPSDEIDDCQCAACRQRAAFRHLRQGCVAPVMRSTLPGPRTPAQASELWEHAGTIWRRRDLFDGPWGKVPSRPIQRADYTFVSAKTVGVSPGSQSPTTRAWSGASSRAGSDESKSSCLAFYRPSAITSRRSITCHVDDHRRALDGRAVRGRFSPEALGDEGRG